MRQQRILDLSVLDHVSWPEYMWEWLRLKGTRVNVGEQWRVNVGERMHTVVVRRRYAGREAVGLSGGHAAR